MRTRNELIKELQESRDKGQALFNEIEAKNEDGSHVLDNDQVQAKIDDLKTNGKHIDSLVENLNQIDKEISDRREVLLEEQKRLNGIPLSAYSPNMETSNSGEFESFSQAFVNKANRDPNGAFTRSGEVAIPGLFEAAFWNAQPVATADFETARPFAGVYGAPVQPPVFLDLFNIQAVDKLKFDWLLQTTRSMAATGVAEAAAAPASDFVWTTQNVSLKRIRHITVVTDDILSSEMMLGTLIEQEMISGVREEASTQVLRGTTTNSVSGLIGRAGINTASSGAFSGYTGAEILDACEEGLREVLTVGRAQPEAVAVHPTVWGTVKTTKIAEDTQAGSSTLQSTNYNQYAYHNPFSPFPMTLWGTPVRETTEFAVPAASTTWGVVGAFRRHSFVPRMGGITLETTDSHGTQFASWQTTMRAGAYMDLVVTRPSAFSALNFSS